MALLSPAATLVRSRRAAVAANAGRAAAGVTTSGAAAAGAAAVRAAAAEAAAAGAAAAGAAAAGAAAAHKILNTETHTLKVYKASAVFFST
jgi:hypothetical protein